MTKITNLFEKKYEIHYYEVDYKKNVLITTLIDFLGDISISHSDAAGVGMDYLADILGAIQMGYTYVEIS